MPASLAPSSFTDDSEGSRVSYRARYCDLLEREVGELRGQVVFLKDVISSGGMEPPPSHSPESHRAASVRSAPLPPSNLGRREAVQDHELDWLQPSVPPPPHQVANDLFEEEDELCNTNTTTMVVDELTGKIQIQAADGQAIVPSDKVPSAEKLEIIHERIVMLFEDRRLRQIMAAWGEVVVEREGQENLDLLLVRRYRNRIKKKVVFKWYHYYLEEMRSRHKMGQVQRKLNRMKLRAFLGKWVQFAEQVRKKRLMIEHMLRRLHYYSTRGVFHVWWGKCRRRQRHEYLTQKFLARWRGNTLSNNLFVWRETAKRFKRGRAIIKRFEDRRSRCFAREAAQLWAKAAHRGSCERSQQIALENFKACSADPFFSSWEGCYSSWCGLEVEPDSMEVTKILLPSRSLRALPNDIGKLVYVNALYLEGNQLQELPPEVGELSGLQTLRVQQNHLRSMPAEIGRLTELQLLWAFSNSLEVLPDSVSSLANLTSLQLHNNSLAALPEAIGNLKALQSLLLNGNQLKHLPTEIGQLSELTSLVLSSNKLEALPPELWGLSSLTRLNLAGNLLKELDTPEMTMPVLKELNLCDNQLEALPPGIGLLSALEALHLTNNKLAELPPQITHLVSLDLLHIAGNCLTTLPGGMSALTALRSLYAFGNKLSKLPEDLFAIGSLEKLSLSTNEIEVLPDTMGSLSSIRILCLNENKLTELPGDALGKLLSLEVIKLEDNQLTSVPASLGGLSNLQEMSLDGNSIEGLPEEVERLASTCEISLNDTKAPKELVAKMLAPHADKAPIIMPVVRGRRRRSKAAPSPRPEAGMQTWSPGSGQPLLSHAPWSDSGTDTSPQHQPAGQQQRAQLRATESFSVGDYESPTPPSREAADPSTGSKPAIFSASPSSRFSRTKSLKHMDIFTRSASPRDRMVAESTAAATAQTSGASTPDYYGNSTWSPASSGDFRRAASAALAATRLAQLGSTGGRSVGAGNYDNANNGRGAGSPSVRDIIGGASTPSSAAYPTSSYSGGAPSATPAEPVNFFGSYAPSPAAGGLNFFGVREPLSLSSAPTNDIVHHSSGPAANGGPVNFFGSARTSTEAQYGTGQGSSGVNFFGTPSPMNFGGAPLPGAGRSVSAASSGRPVSASEIRFGIDQQPGAGRPAGSPGFYFPTGQSAPGPISSGGYSFGVPAQSAASQAGVASSGGVRFGVPPQQQQGQVGYAPDPQSQVYGNWS